MPTLCHLIRRCLREDNGQDLIEYGILTGIVVALGVAIFTSINGKLASAYDNWGNEIELNWEPDNPVPPTP